MLALCAGLAALPGVSAQDEAEDAAAIAALVDSLAEAWDQGDAAAFSARFAEDGGFTNVLGSLYYGREAFQARHAALFAGPFEASDCELTLGRLKFVRGDVAIADVDAVVTGADPLPGIEVEADGAVRTRLQLVLTKEDDGWWIAAFHNVAVMPPPPSAP
jgi:uncharacterized protein (TIGR02246 family)